jgi:RNA-directed DNA polymerase
MIGIKSPRSLASALGLPLADIQAVAKNRADYIHELVVVDPSGKDKPRPVIDVRGALWRLQKHIQIRLFQKALSPVPWSHGGVKGRSIKSNVAPHLGNSWVFTTDLSKFYPSIHYHRVYDLMIEMRCSPDVARLLTQLCTYKHHLALGLLTSPILADAIFRRTDNRLWELSRRLGLAYSRFVDDITFSGDFNFESSGVPDAVVRIVAEDGFVIQKKKHKMGPADKVAITQLRVVRGHVDVRYEYVRALYDQAAQLRELAADRPFAGVYTTRSQFQGKVQFVLWVNNRRRRSLLKLLRSVDWLAVKRNGEARGLFSLKKITVSAKLVTPT